MAVSDLIASRRMQKEYGTNSMHVCRECCNYQKQAKGKPECICIAYGNDVIWDGNTRACAKLFNYPFRNLRPKRRQLEEMYPEHKIQKSDTSQISLF